MIKTAQNLEQVIRRVQPLLLDIPAATAALRPAPGKWSPKEIIGHLIDSAANNHQRFVRAMAGTTEMTAYRYDQNHWVASQNYQEESWEDLVHLWFYYNLHLSRVMAQIPDNTGDVLLQMGPTITVTLQYVVEDYLVHLEHHLTSIPVSADRG